MKAIVGTSLVAKLTLFTAAMVGLGLLCAGVGYAFAGMGGVESAIWATALCLPPGWLVFCVEPMYRLPLHAVYGSLVSSMARLGLVTGGVLLAVHLRPELPRRVLIGCLAVQYLGSLAIETRVLLRGLPLRRPLAGSRRGA